MDVNSTSSSPDATVLMNHRQATDNVEAVLTDYTLRHGEGQLSSGTPTGNCDDDDWQDCEPMERSG